jgi:hypothetical protein
MLVVHALVKEGIKDIDLFLCSKRYILTVLETSPVYSCVLLCFCCVFVVYCICWNCIVSFVSC